MAAKTSLKNATTSTEVAEPGCYAACTVESRSDLGKKKKPALSKTRTKIIRQSNRLIGEHDRGEQLVDGHATIRKNNTTQDMNRSYLKAGAKTRRVVTEFWEKKQVKAQKAKRRYQREKHQSRRREKEEEGVASGLNENALQTVDSGSHCSTSRDRTRVHSYGNRQGKGAGTTKRTKRRRFKRNQTSSAHSDGQSVNGMS